MNCQETSHLLDAMAPEALTSMQREAIERHLAACASCREDWANWRELAALPVPATPPTLRLRLRTVLSAWFAVPPRRAFRPYVVGGALLVGAALAAALALQFVRGKAQATVYVAAPAASASEASAEGSTQSVPPADAANARGDGSTPAAADGGSASAAAEPAAEKPLDPHRILVLSRPEAAADVQALALAGRCHDALLSELRSFKDLKVVTADAVHTTSSFEELIQLTERDRRIARRLGAGRTVVVSTEGGCHLTLFDSQTGVMVPGAGGSGVAPDGVATGTAELFGRGNAHQIRDKTLFDMPALLADAKTKVLDAGLSERERIGALTRPRSLAGSPEDSKAIRAFYDREVVAAAAAIGVKSADVRVRQAVWSTLRDVKDPVLVEPLRQALASDPDASVRYQVAFALHAYLDQPGVREALQRAAAEDPSKDPPQARSLSVREAAERASIADKDFRDWVLGRLLDENLPARARLLHAQSGSPDGRFMTVGQLGPEAARVVFDIGRRERDPQVRAMAWTSLWVGTPEEEYVPVMLDDLASHPDEEVRTAAVNVLDVYLQKRGDNPDVRAALERARSDQSIDVRRRASWALEQLSRATGK